MKITLLGTGNANTTNCYNTCFVLSEKDRYFMVDAGGGNAILGQLKKAGFHLHDMRDIFVTHSHIDHLLGVFWLMRMICADISYRIYEGEARIYGNEKVIAAIHAMIPWLMSEKHRALIGDRLHLIEVRHEEEREIAGFPVRFFDVLSTKEKQYGFTMQLPSGDKLACCGDEPYRESEKPYVEGSKWLLHEAFCLYSDRDIYHPYKKHHSTVKDACETAEALKIPNLILYHTEEEHLAERKQLYYKEGSQYYHGNLFIPDDLESVVL